MLPESRHRSSGRMSAPRQEAASKARTTPQPPYQSQPLRGSFNTGVPKGAREVVMACSRGLSSVLQGGQLLVDLGQLGLFVGVGQGGVGLQLVALAKQVQLANGHQLG